MFTPSTGESVESRAGSQATVKERISAYGTQLCSLKSNHAVAKRRRVMFKFKQFLKDNAATSSPDRWRAGKIEAMTLCDLAWNRKMVEFACYAHIIKGWDSKMWAMLTHGAEFSTLVRWLRYSPLTPVMCRLWIDILWRCVRTVFS